MQIGPVGDVDLFRCTTVVTVVIAMYSNHLAPYFIRPSLTRTTLHLTK